MRVLNRKLPIHHNIEPQEENFQSEIVRHNGRGHPYVSTIAKIIPSGRAIETNRS